MVDYHLSTVHVHHDHLQRSYHPKCNDEQSTTGYDTHDSSHVVYFCMYLQTHTHKRPTCKVAHGLEFQRLQQGF